MSDDIEGQTAATIQAVASNAKRLGLSWDMTMATIVDGSDRGNIVATFDGDDAPTVGLISMIGYPIQGDRVYVMTVPPAGNYVVARVNSEYQDYYRVTTTQGAVVFDGIPAGLRELKLSYSALSDAAGAIVEIKMRINGIGTGSYITQRLVGNAGVVSAALVDNLATSAFVGYIGGAGSGVYGSGDVVYQAWDRGNDRRPQWTWSNGVMSSGGIYQAGAGNLVALAPLVRVELFANAANFVAGSEFYIRGY